MRFLVIIAAASLILSGCAGYHVGPVKPTPMREVRTIAVPSFVNLTLEPRLEVLMASILIKQLQQDGTYRVTSEGDADAVAECTIDQIERTPSRGVRNNSSTNVSADFYQTTEFTLNLKVTLKVFARSTGEVLAKRQFVGNSSFFVSGANPRTANVNRDERQAIPQAAEDVAIQITSYLSEGW